MPDDLTRALAEALGCEPDATDDKQGYACREHGDTSTAAWPCPVLTEIAAILTSTDPDVHAALLAALVRAGVLLGSTEYEVRLRHGMVGGVASRERYVTRWVDVDGCSCASGAEAKHEEQE